MEIAQAADRNHIATKENMYPTNSLSSTMQTHIQASRTGELIAGIIVSDEINIRCSRNRFLFYSFVLKTYSIIIILSIIGNAIVVTAICRVQRLRHPTNFILMSLAIADLLVTTTVMIPGFIYEIKQKWIFGTVFCNVWLANDITFCTASILHLGR